MKPSIEYVVYFIGVVLPGFLYTPIQSALGSGAVFFAGAAAYLFALRALGKFAARLSGRGGRE